MRKQSTLSIVSMISVLVSLVVSACAPISPAPSLSPIATEIASVPIGTPVPDFAGQIVEPLIKVGDDGQFQPGLAASVSSAITSTLAGQFVQVNFVLSPNGPVGDNSPTRIEAIPTALQQMTGIDGKGFPGGNPCIAPTPKVSKPSAPFSMLPKKDDDRTISIIIPLEECGGDAEACTKQIMDNVANLPLFNPSNLTFNALTETGRYVFKYRNIAGSDGTLEYDPKTGEIDPCPECEPTVPSSKRVCPTATP